MKLTKKLEAEVLDVYEAYWGGLLNVDMEIYSAVLDNDFKLIGTTEAEVFFKKMEAVRFLKATADQVAGNIELRNRIIKIEPVDELVLITEQCDAYVTIDNVWVFYAKTRTSSLLQKKDSRWKFVQMHISFPDSKSEEGESIGLEKISKENLELREAVKRRTIELENKSRELEIEAALERVRTVAMAMQHPDDMLDMCQVISKELENLDVADIRNIQTAIINENKEAYLNYEYFRLQKKKIITAVEYKKQKDIHAFVKRMLKDPEGFFTTQFKGASLKQWIQYQVKTDQFVDPATKKAASLHYYFYSIGPGALGISTYAPLTKDAIYLFKRFRNVFQLAYQRFVDIQKAEAQAKEAQIELALERVRARTMAMQHSEELAETVAVMFEQFKTLGEEPERMAIEIVNEKEHVFEIWATQHGGSQLNLLVRLSLDEPHVMQKMYKAWKAKAKSITIDLQGNELEEYFNYLKKQGLPVQRKIFGKRRVQNVATFSKGILTIITPEPRPQETISLLERFASVFEQTYTRFLDLQKAEEQAREAQIQLAMERVRSKAMAMHNSDDLAITVDSFFIELKLLHIVPHRCGVTLINEETHIADLTVTTATQNGEAKKLTGKLHLTGHPILDGVYDNWKQQQEFYPVLQGDQIREYYKVMNPQVEFPDFSADEVQYGYYFFFKEGGVFAWTDKKLNEEVIQIFRKFTSVLSLTYRRYMDLKDAEAQAREAQIELGLERVRARAMAMQKSDELSELVDTVFKELTKLDFALNWCIINIIDEPSLTNMVWAANPETNKPPESYLMKFEDFPFHHSMMKGYQERKTKHVYVLEGKEKKTYDDYLFNKTEWRRVPKAAQAASRAMKRYVATFTFSNFGGLQTVGEEYLSEENLDILSRFGKVFDLTYTRFNDLQKAEAQAREAQIEAALERVRSRSMGMQKSEELKEVIKIVYQQIRHLNIHLDHAGFVVDYKPKGDWHFWIADEQDIPSKITHPYFESVWASQFIEAKEKGADFFATHLSFEEKNKFYNELLSYVPGLPEASKDFYLSCPGLAASTVLLENVGLYIENFSGTPYTDEENTTLMRFGKVFQQTYTRFLDLQKAEAQTREAEIELALERVRAAAMAMRDSAEIGEIIYRLYGELTKLDAKLDRCFIMIVNPENQGITWWLAGKEGLLAENGFFIPMNQHPTHLMYLDCSKKRTKKWQYLFEGKEKRDWDRFGFSKTELTRLPDFIKQDMAAVKKIYLSGSSDQFGSLVTGSLESLPDEQQEIISRFTIAFNQTYIRFLDLQKAEAQAREAQIEAAMERVRSRSMAMHKSEELLEAGEILFLEMQKLGIESLTAGYVLIDKEEKNGLNYTPHPGTKKIMPEPVIIPHNETSHMQQVVENWKKGNSFFIVEMDEDETIHHQTFIAERSTNFPLTAAQLIAISPAKLFLHNFYFKEGYVLIVGGTKLSAEQTDIMLRFAKVFQQTYTRFLDLQKAEAQAREAEIELALERVRARTMAMQHSDELPDAATILFQQVQSLGMPAWSAGYCTWNEDKPAVTLWMSSEGVLQPPFTAPTTEDELFIQMRKGQEAGKTFHVVEMGGDKLVKHYQYMRTLPLMGDILDSIIAAGHPLPTFQIMHHAYFSKGFLLFITYEPVPDAHDIFKRFGKVFDQTYTRFLDLQKAEAQAREAQIEAALERVRSSSLAMHRSDELQGVVNTVIEQLKELNIELDTTNILIFNTESKSIEFWTGSNSTGKQLTNSWQVSCTEYILLKEMLEAQQNGQEVFLRYLSFEEKNRFFDYLFTRTDFRNLNAERKKFIFKSERASILGALVKDVAIQILSYSRESFLSDEIEILKRFAKVFEQAHTRFLDLQKAEAQAREAQIEASLERVRSKTMAMHNSNDVGESVATLFDELAALGLLSSFDRCGIGIMQPNEIMELWTAEKSTGKTELTIGHLNMQHHTLLKNVYQNWLDKKETYQYILEGTDKLNYYEAMRNQANYKIKKDYYSAYERVVHTDFFFKEGCLYVFSLNEFTTEATSIFIRFVNVFGQTYRRYLDLQKAEAQAREAQIETALEKVRSRTLAMQKSDELAETAAVLFQQLIALGIEPNRLYISIIKSETGNTEFWITDEDGSKVSTAFAANMNDNATFLKMYEGWKQQQKSLVIDMQGEELQNYFSHLTRLGVPFKEGLTQKRRVQDIAYFSKGFIGMASPDEQPAETLQLLERFAAVFNLTFTRFNDLKIAEAHAEQAEQDLIAIKEAKQKAEEALTELQSTQKQLIQSEKMASLGELTAGIAHEIQNPLNFVNNFSEVSTELVDEMNEEIAKGNLEDAAAIANDLKQNLEKINHHGKRAGDIVKGMLQHSRSSSGQKEPTDINALADEYLRLAYHGLRAKDKAFNAALKTDYDESIGNINIIPQDIGRVILNLITNAFYVVNEKILSAVATPTAVKYEPTVSVSTKKVNSMMELRVADNGNGITQNILDKIFQPFFTTKPTGQGTGLGLSLSYDIVKAHGGELKVETREGEGTTFIIQLPVKEN